MTNTLAWLLAALAVADVLRAAEPSAADVEFFEKRVRPVLATRCFECHGPDAAESGLRLDSRAAVLKGGARGSAVNIEAAQNSVLILAVNHADQLHMPPKSKLPQREIDDLTEWVRRGAPWPGEQTDLPATTAHAVGGLTITAADREFWAFRPVVRPAVPPAGDAGWVRTPIDRFIADKLAAAGLSPAPAADKRTLIRRATFDLIGLPPTPEEVAAFVADASPDAFERLVDRLLASPHYGERWGRHWLDLARYGDSNGLDENLAFAHAYRYRDYVVEAFNADRPYDEFITEQLAGDLLPTDDPALLRRRLTATGFLVIGAKMLAEDDPVKMEMDIIDEQVDTLGKALLGMTFGCARCHDHKYDPVAMTDYYALAGIFKSTQTMENFSVVARWKERPLALPDEIAARDRIVAEAQAVQREIDAAIAAERTRLLADVRKQTAAYLLAAQREHVRKSLPTIASARADGDVAQVAGARLIEAERYDRGNVHKDFGTYGQGIGVLVNRGETPNFVEYDVELPAAGLYQLDVRLAAAQSRPCTLHINGALARSQVAAGKTGSWTPESQRWFVEGVFPLQAGRNVLRLEHPQFFPHIDKLALRPAPAVDDAPAGGPELLAETIARWATVLQQPDSPFAAWRHFTQHRGWDAFDAAGDPWSDRLLAEPRPQTLPALAQRYQDVLAAWEPQLLQDGAPTDANPHAGLAELRQTLRSDKGPWHPSAIPETAFAAAVRESLAAQRARHQRIAQTIPQFPETMAVSEGAPQNLRVHLRGSHLTLGAPTQRRFPAVFDRGRDPEIGASESGRRQLAQWLTSRAHPLTSRVFVNRVWQQHFGEGLVRSPDNFGRLGETPSHPELLDWLAAEFMDSGWSIKQLHRLILTSATWRQSAAWNPQAAAVDPENRLLWRMPRRRLEAEALRDALLAVGGGLDDALGGSLLPTENRRYVTSTANVNPKIYDSRRRTLYLPVVRSAVYDFLQAFDFGDPSVLQGKRERTTVAPQALFLMNSEIVAEQSRGLAAHLLDAVADDDARLERAFSVLLARPPSAPERSAAREFLAQHQRAQGAADAAAAPRQAWAALCRALLMSNEFLYVN